MMFNVKKITVLVLSLFLCISIFSMSFAYDYTDSNSNKNSNYNRDSATNYALNYANKPNPNYYNYGSDCTNFVSQCLYNGTMAQIKPPSLTKANMQNPYYWHYTKQGMLFGVGVSNSWTAAPDFRKHWGNDSSGGNNRAYALRGYGSPSIALDNWETIYQFAWQGDPIVFLTSSGIATHVGIITKFFSQYTSEIYYCQHSNGTDTVSKNQPLKVRLQNMIKANQQYKIVILGIKRGL